MPVSKKVDNKKQVEYITQSYYSVVYNVAGYARSAYHGLKVLVL